jgi:hypothetical protein
MTSAVSFQSLFAGQRVVFDDVRVGESVQVHVDQRQAHHVGRDVVAVDVGGEVLALVRCELVAGARFAVVLEDVLPGRNQEARRAAGRVENAFVLLRVDDLDHEVDDVARRAELAGVALAAEHREQVFEGVAQRSEWS